MMEESTMTEDEWLAKMVAGCKAEDLARELALENEPMWDDYSDEEWEEPPLYADRELSAKDEAGLQEEWDRHCRIHDRGVDNLPMGHPTIEEAATCLRLVEAEQRRRGMEVGSVDPVA
jgi:hypothetical protein